MAIRRNINYINKEFSEYRSQLINYSQTYFPKTYSDFNESSPGMMFIEMASYVGDVLSFYLDNQVQENFLQYARQNSNLYDLAYMWGYRPKATGLAETTMEFYPELPDNNEYVPDYDYSVTIPSNTSISTQTGTSIKFSIEDPIDFSVSSSSDTTEVFIAQTNAGVPSYYLLQKTRKAFSGTITTDNFTFTNPQEFQTITLASPNIAGIIDIFDSEGNRWYEVDYLAQNTIYEEVKNTALIDPELAQFNEQTPYLLKLRKTSETIP